MATSRSARGSGGVLGLAVAATGAVRRLSHTPSTPVDLVFRAAGLEALVTEEAGRP